MSEHKSAEMLGQGLGSIGSVCAPSHLESQKYMVMFALAVLRQKGSVVTVCM